MTYNKLTDNGHLDIKGYLDFAGLVDENGNIESKFLFILLSPRDCGKSTSMWNYVINDYWIKSNWEKQLIYTRNNTSKTDNFIHSFNNSFKDLGLKMSSNKIEKLDLNTNKRVDSKTLGTVMGISVSENFKSAISDNYELIFWEEFNEYDGSDILDIVSIKRQNQLYLNFVDTIKTYERHRDSNFRVFLLGNKVSPQNDLLLTFDIAPPIDHNKDLLYIRDVEGLKIRIVICADQTFSNIKNHKKTLANALATFDERTNRYINNGGWLVEPDEDVVSFKSISEKVQPLYNIIYNQSIFEFGEIENEHYYILNVSKESYLKNLPTYALDHISSLWIKNSIKYDQKDNTNLAEFLESIYKNNQLYFCSKFAKSWIIQFIIRNIGSEF